LPFLREVRQHLHQYPELSFREEKTMVFLSEMLRKAGIAHKTGIGGTGITGEFNGREAGKRVVLLRADMDALPVQEENDVLYRSRHEGVMHACGHDVHSASLLGALIILHRLKAEWTGTVRFVFQPGEEKLPGGALDMIRAGILKNPAPVAAIAQHVFPGLPVGTIGFGEGPYMASADELYFTVRGKGGHAAQPEKTINPLTAASHLLLQLDQINRETGPEGQPFVLSVGKMNAPGATNVIPETVELEGTVRTFDEAWRKQVHALIEEKVAATDRLYGTTTEYEIRKGYPVLVNDPALTGRLRKAAEEYLGRESVESLPLRLTSEDFGWYAQQVPGCFYRLGTASAGSGYQAGLHSPRFDIDENALSVGAGLMAWLALHG